MLTCSICTRRLNLNTVNGDDRAVCFGSSGAFESHTSCLNRIHPLAKNLFKTIYANHRYTYSTAEATSNALSFISRELDSRRYSIQSFYNIHGPEKTKQLFDSIVVTEDCQVRYDFQWPRNRMGAS